MKATDFFRALDDSDLDYLATIPGADGRPLFQPGFLAYLRGQRFTGTVDVVKLNHREVEQVHESFAQTLLDLRAGLDVHGAVIECWRRLADLAADSGVPRRASQTAEEYTIAILGSLPVDRIDLRTLADLYETAMFSGAESAPADRDQAIGCLERLSASLGVTR